MVLTPKPGDLNARVGRQNVATTPYEEYWAPDHVRGHPVYRRRELDRPTGDIGAVYWNAMDVPIGIQFMGASATRATLLRLAGQIERARPWFDRRRRFAAASSRILTRFRVRHTVDGQKKLNAGRTRE